MVAATIKRAVANPTTRPTPRLVCIVPSPFRSGRVGVLLKSVPVDDVRSEHDLAVWTSVLADLQLCEEVPHGRERVLG